MSTATLNTAGDKPPYTSSINISGKPHEDLANAIVAGLFPGGCLRDYQKDILWDILKQFRVDFAPKVLPVPLVSPAPFSDYDPDTYNPNGPPVALDKAFCWDHTDAMYMAVYGDSTIADDSSSESTDSPSHVEPGSPSPSTAHDIIPGSPTEVATELDYTEEFLLAQAHRDDDDQKVDVYDDKNAVKTTEAVLLKEDGNISSPGTPINSIEDHTQETATKSKIVVQEFRTQDTAITDTSTQNTTQAQIFSQEVDTQGTSITEMTESQHDAPFDKVDRGPIRPKTPRGKFARSPRSQSESPSKKRAREDDEVDHPRKRFKSLSPSP